MDQLIARARSGDRQAREELLELLRPQLRQWAALSLNSRFGGRVDASDVTQITLLDIHEKLAQFVGNSERELLDWVRRALERNILDSIRRATAQKRSVERERSIDQSAPGEQMPRGELVGSFPTPSLQAMRNEDRHGLEAALAQLLPDQRAAVQLVHLDGLGIAAAAERMNRTPAATAKLLQRGIANLRRILSQPTGE